MLVGTRRALLGGGLRPAFWLNAVRGGDAPASSHSVNYNGGGNGTRVNSAGLIAAAAINAPRVNWDPVSLAVRGLLMEEQRTNSVRRSDASGAVPGSPGTLPTNWIWVPAGLSFQVVAVGAEDGIPYVDVRITGTATGGNTEIRPGALDEFAAAAGQTWSQSWYFKLMAGSLSGIAGTRIQTIYRNAALAFVEGPNVSFTPAGASARFSASRVTFSAAAVSATIAFGQPDFVISQAASGSIDATFRIGGIQMELGASPASYIPTAGSSVIRGVDSAVVETVPFYNPQAGTIIATVDKTFGDPGAGSTIVAQFDDGTTNNRIALRLNSRAATSAPQITVLNAGAVVANSSSPAFMNLQAAPRRIGITWGGGRGFVAGEADAAPLEVALASLPSSITRLSLGAGAGALPLNGHLREVAYYPAQVGAAGLMALLRG